MAENSKPRFLQTTAAGQNDEDGLGMKAS